MAGNAEDATEQGAAAKGASAQDGTDGSRERDVHDMGGDSGATPPSSRGGGGLGPEQVRAADAHASGEDPPAGAVDDDHGPGEQGGTYHGEGVGRQERVSSGPATGTPGNPHPPQVHHSDAPEE